MLEAFRNAAKGWVAKILLSLLVASFAVWGITDVFRGFQNADLAQVGDQTISSPAYQTALNRQLQVLGQQSGTPLTLEDARKLGIDQQVLDRMIASAALDAQGDRLKIAIADQAIINAVQNNPAFHNAQGQFDPAVFDNLLRQNGLNQQAYLASEKSNLLRGSLTRVAGETISVPRTLLDAMLRYKNETRDARYISFAVSEADLPQPSDDDLKKQYESTPAAYTAPEYRSIAVLKVDPADIASKIQISDEELKAGYDANKQDYFTPEKRTIIQLSFPDVAAADAAKARLDNGEDIMKIATELGMKEADVTFTDRTKGDFLDSKIAEAAFGLAEGAVSAPVQGSLNTALIKAIKVTPEHQGTLDEVRDPLRKHLQEERAKEEIQSVYDAVEDARAQETKFEDIASKAGIPLTVIPAISATGQDKAGADVALPHKEEILKAAYASDVGVENDALTLGDGYAWYEVREVMPSALRPFDTIKDIVKADWAAAKLRNFASEKAKAILAKAGSNTKLETIATEVNGTVKSVTAVKRNETSAEFDGVATLALFSAPEKSLTWALEGDGKTARIIEVSKVTVPAFEAGSVDSKQMADLAKQGMGGDLLDSYIKAVRAETTVTVNEDLWSKIRGSSTAP